MYSYDLVIHTHTYIREEKEEVMISRYIFQYFLTTFNK